MCRGSCVREGERESIDMSGVDGTHLDTVLISFDADATFWAPGEHPLQHYYVAHDARERPLVSRRHTNEHRVTAGVFDTHCASNALTHSERARCTQRVLQRVHKAVCACTFPLGNGFLRDPDFLANINDSTQQVYATRGWHHSKIADVHNPERRVANDISEACSTRRRTTRTPRTCNHDEECRESRRPSAAPHSFSFCRTPAPSRSSWSYTWDSSA